MATKVWQRTLIFCICNSLPPAAVAVSSTFEIWLPDALFTTTVRSTEYWYLRSQFNDIRSSVVISKLFIELPHAPHTLEEKVWYQAGLHNIFIFITNQKT